MWPFQANGKFAEIKSIVPKFHADDYTPDRLWLERHEWKYLFVYDELMLNRRKYELIKEDSVRMWQAFTEEDQFALWKKKLGTETISIPLKGADRVYDGPGVTSVKLDKIDPRKIKPGILGRIKGEIHAVRPHLFWKVLDKHYLNGIEFKRKRVRLIVPYRVEGSSDEFVQKITADMYVGIKDYWSSQLDGGLLFSQVGAFVPNKTIIDAKRIGLYYYYSRLEDATNF